MDFEQARAFRARIRAGLTTADAVAERYRERSLDTAEGSFRSTTIATEDEMAPYKRREPEKEVLVALKERAANGWAPARKVPS